MSDGHDPDTTFSKMQETINHWEGVSKATGGAPAPNKCWWYLIEIEWDKQENWLYKETEPENEMVARDKDSTWRTLKYKKVSEAVKCQEFIFLQMEVTQNRRVY